MGEKKEKAKSILGFIALGCALAVACVVAAPALAVVGVVVGTTTIISASTVVGVTAVVATVGATAAVTKAALHVSDGEYQEAIESAAMAVPMIGTAYCYGNAYIGMTGSSGRMTPGSNPSQAGPKSNPAPNQSAGNSSGQGNLNKGLGTYENQGGHHPMAKSAFEGVPGYDPQKALTISKDQLESFGVKHSTITGQQHSLYSEYANTGQPLTINAMRDIEIQAMTNSGVPIDYAVNAVDNAIADLVKSGITAPVAIPWN